MCDVQICSPEMTIMESKPDNTVPDLRLAQPWPELCALANSIDLDSCCNMVHKHIPYGAQLCHYKRWWLLKEVGAYLGSTLTLLVSAFLGSGVNTMPTLHTVASFFVPAAIEQILCHCLQRVCARTVLEPLQI
jgi:hypothetical protein